jgi:hypothetical protein
MKKYDCIQSRTVPPTTPREKQRKEHILGGTVPVKKSQTQKILQNLAKPESHGGGTVLTSAKSKWEYFQAVENLKHLETSKNSRNRFKQGKTSSKISSKIKSKRTLWEKLDKSDVNSASSSTCDGPMGGVMYSQKNCAAHQHSSGY